MIQKFRGSWAQVQEVARQDGSCFPRLCFWSTSRLLRFPVTGEQGWALVGRPCKKKLALLLALLLHLALLLRSLSLKGVLVLF